MFPASRNTIGTPRIRILRSLSEIDKTKRAITTTCMSLSTQYLINCSFNCPRQVSTVTTRQITTSARLFTHDMYNITL